MSSENNKRIAKNTMMLYIRMMLTMVVALYTSRIILSTLGIEDFGIYNIVGGVVAMFSFLNASMSGATSRFLTFELGIKNSERLQLVFSSAMTIHLIIAAVILLVGETIGLYFLEYVLIIPQERMEAARWVYQFSIISTIISILLVPYNASIIAHEKMNVYAYVEILNATMKLIIVYLLTIGQSDRLILYSFLILIVSLTVALIYRIYCIRHFNECHLKMGWNKELIYPMLSFSGWDLYGNMSVMARTQGTNMLLNLFFGPLLNAASGIATQVQSAIMAFAGNVVTAIRPQIVKSYAAGDYEETVKLLMNGAKFTYILLLAVSLPILLEMNFILNLWLKEVPAYTVLFCQYTLTFNFFANMSVIVISAIHATGKIKRPSIINGTLYLSVVPVSYIVFKMGGDPSVPYLLNVIFVLCGLLSNAWTLNKYIPQFSFWQFVIKVIGVCLIITIISGITSGIFKFYISEGWIRFICIAAVSTITILISTYYIAMNATMRLMAKSRIVSYYNKHK